MRFHLAVYENGTEYNTQRNCVTCNGCEIGTEYSTHQKMCDFLSGTVGLAFCIC